MIGMMLMKAMIFLQHCANSGVMRWGRKIGMRVPCAKFQMRNRAKLAEKMFEPLIAEQQRVTAIEGTSRIGVCCGCIRFAWSENDRRYEEDSAVARTVLTCATSVARLSSAIRQAIRIHPQPHRDPRRPLSGGDPLLFSVSGSNIFSATSARFRIWNFCALDAHSDFFPAHYAGACANAGRNSSAISHSSNIRANSQPGADALEGWLIAGFLGNQSVLAAKCE